ncbi:protein SMAX1-LIKE 3 [Capsicum galapagoense]
MRTGGCTIQQALTTEAASVVKQAVTLAKRRGHAQVTPLHVANTMLSASSNGIFKTACLQSHSHPLQCKALELCFNVALNRLPASSSSPMLLGHQHQSHHSQYPSISNALVAAFKRAQAHQRRGSLENQQQPLLAVKIELEQLIISILDDPSVSRVMREAGFDSTQVKSNVEQVVPLELCSQNSKEIDHNKGPHKKVSPVCVKNEDVMSVVESLMNKNRKNVVLVSESIDNLEGVIKGVMNKVENKDVPDDLKEIKFISLPLLSFGNIQREEVDQRIGELTCLVKSLVKKGVVLYLGDLKWVADYRVNYGERRIISYYCSVEHMIVEIGRLVCSFCENEKFWLVGIATFQSYMRCKSGNNSLESTWGLHPVTVPGGSLGLSLNHDSDTQIELGSKTFEGEFSCGEEKLQLSNLPSWLKDERSKKHYTDNNHHHDQNCVPVKDLHNKWNTTCHLPFWANRKTCETNSSTPNSASNSSDLIMEMEYHVPKFKEFNSENLNILSNALEETVPWQKGIVIQEIVATILQCRSRMMRRREKSPINEAKQETWLFFQGPDVHAKEKIARELANVVFGSYSNFVSIGLNNFVSNFRNKRSRDEQSWSYIDKFAQAVSCNSHCVFYLEDLEEIDYCSLRGIKNAIERGTITNSTSGDQDVSLDDAIIILSCENFGSKSSRACSPNVKQKIEETTTSPKCVSLDLNLSIDDQYGSGDQDLSIDDDVGLLQSVDKCIFFQNSRTIVE